jgi:hypothetical protein
VTNGFILARRRRKRRERRDRRERRLRNREFGRREAKPRVGQTPACPSLKTHVPVFWAGIEGLFKKARQLVEKLIKKLYSYSKNATNTVRASHFSVQRVKKARQLVRFIRQKNIQLVGKTFTLVKHSVKAKNFVVIVPAYV